MNTLKNQPQIRGFTLTEILIIIAVIGILLGIVLTSFSQVRAASRDAVRVSDLRTLEKMLEMYKYDHNRYPTSTAELQIIGQSWGSDWKGYGIIPKDPLSPKQDYVYISDQGRDYQIYAKFERDPVNQAFACAESCGPNAEYNGGISSVGTTTLIAFEPLPVPPPSEEDPPSEEEPPPTENGEEEEEEEEEEPAPPPEEGEPVACTPPFPEPMRGEQVYSVSGSAANPRIIRVTINPLDVDRFAIQTVTVLARDIAGHNITLLEGEVFTDNTSVVFERELISGTKDNGTWQGQWYNEDEYCSNYHLTVRATSASGSSEAALTFR